VERVRLRDYELRSIDVELIAQADQQGHQLPPGVTLEPTGRIDASWQPDLFLPGSPATDKAREQFKRLAAVADGFPIGRVRFENVHLLGPQGLVVDRARRIAWFGEALGWSTHSVEISVTAFGGAVHQDGTVSLDDDIFIRAKADLPDHAELPHPRGWFTDPDFARRPRSYADLQLLTLPGFAIYGHWLIDVVPRLATVAHAARNRAVYTQAFPTWSGPFVRPFESELGPRVTGRPGTVAYAELVDVHTVLKRVKVLDRPRMALAWKELGDGLDQLSPVSDAVASYGPRLYVSRAGWASGRALSNHGEVEEAMRRRGYSVIRPQELSLPEQRRVFARATHVVGEDGSALHNVIHCAPGARLAVIDLDRTNVFHASVANVVGHHVAHLASEERDGHWSIDAAGLGRQLDEIGL